MNNTTQSVVGPEKRPPELTDLTNVPQWRTYYKLSQIQHLA